MATTASGGGRIGSAQPRSDFRRAAVGGCGRTGARIAAALGEMGYEVTVLDIDPAAFRNLADNPPPSAAAAPPRLVVADVTLESRLRAADVHEVDAFVAVVGDDAANALAAQIAYHVFRVPMVVCRVDDPIKRGMYESMDIRAISRVSMFEAEAVRRLEIG